jgi:four helix bundle protein
MEKNSGKKYDLEERTFQFSKKVITYVDRLPGRITMTEIGKQLIRAAGSVGANYIEANEALSKKDFLMRIKICRKEAKEARYWIALSEPLKEYHDEKTELMSVSTELMKIFASIIQKTIV